MLINNNDSMIKTTPHTSKFQIGLRAGLALLLLPVLVFMTGCDSGGNGGGNGNGTTGGEGSTPDPAAAGFVNYDTTQTIDGQDVIAFRERDNNTFGVVPEEPDAIANAREDYVKWTKADGPYLIDGRTIVNEGDTLEIEPGTVVKGVPNQNPDNASVLLVANGGTILAKGTENDPIIFTTQEDDVGSPGNIASTVDGAFGGVIILGNGPKNFPGSRNVEGIPDDVSRASFGSNNPDPNYDAGIFKYAQIRYGGVSIGAGNEINGLTMGALGQDTEISYVEVFNNQDDGFEWFGGDVDAHHLVASRVGDDSYDIDQGFSGTLQYLLAIQAKNRGDRTGEHDSGDEDFGGSDEGDRPFSNPQICNATYVGSGQDGGGDVALKLRDNFAGDYYNSIFYGFPKQMIEVEDASGPDSRARWEAGDLTINNSIAYQFKSVEDLSSPTTDDQLQALVEGWDAAAVGTDGTESLKAYGVTYEDPGITRTFNDPYQSLDPVPSNSSVVTSNTASTPSGCETANYKGAFSPGGPNWAKGWTLSDELGIF